MSLPRPYYEHAGITIYHGDCREILPHVAADVCITDPPYNAQTHENARSNRFKPGAAQAVRFIDFPPLTEEEFLEVMGLAGRAVRRWVVATVAWQHGALLEQRTPEGLRFVRLGAWVKPAPMPQLTGDRPGQGWEAVAVLHRDGAPMRWNGGGKCAVFHQPQTNVRALWPTEKPLSLVSEFVSLFSDPGETVLDPCCGSGTTLVASKELGRRAIGIDVEERACEIAAKRLAQEVLFPASQKEP